MKRRTFIQAVGATALGLPFLSGQIGASAWKGRTKIKADASKRPLRLGLGDDEARVISLLSQRAAAVCLLGGCAMGKLVKTEVPYLSLLVEAKDFAELKRELFKFGVTPVSTVEMPENFIRFVYGSRAYSVFYLKLNDFLKQNTLGVDSPLIPLAHQFLVYSVAEGWMIDPYGALGDEQKVGPTYRARLLLQPELAVAGLECCLATVVDAAVLGLELPVGFDALESRVLAQSVRAREAPVILHHVINHFPDLLEVKGYDFTRRYLESPLCVSAGVAGPGVDLRKACAALDAVQARGHQITSVQMLRVINRQFRETCKISVFGAGIPDYMVAKGLPILRRELLAEAVSASRRLV